MRSENTKRARRSCLHSACYFLYYYYQFILKSAQIDSTRNTNKPHQLLQTERNWWTSLMLLHSLPPQHGSPNVVRETSGDLLVQSEIMDFYITVILNIPYCLKNGCTFYHATLYSLPIQPKFKSVPLGEIGQSLKLTTRLHQVQRLRMSGVKSSLFHMTSRHEQRELQNIN